MTLGTLKQRIYALLNVDVDDVGRGSFYDVIAPLMIASINAVSDKVALAMHCFYKEDDISFSEGAFGAKCSLPKDLAAPISIFAKGKRYGSEAISAVGDSLYFFGGGAGTYTLSYYAFAEAFQEDSDEDTMLAFNDYAADTIAYGVAAELCHSIYPSDMTRYARLATEFDERITARISRAEERGIFNRVFAKQRRDVL